MRGYPAAGAPKICGAHTEKAFDISGKMLSLYRDRKERFTTKGKEETF